MFHTNNIAAIQKCCRYAYSPNAKGYCGTREAQSKFVACINHGLCAGVVDELRSFIVLHPYLQTVAEAISRKPFSKDVIDAYWIGNDHLRSVDNHHYKTLLNAFAQQGVPEHVIEKCRKNTPKRFVPIHLFNILHVGVGQASGSVPFTLDSINNCMIRWGRVTRIFSTKIEVQLFSLSSTYRLVHKKITQTFATEFPIKVRAGDLVTAHWGSVVEKISEEKASRLAYWTSYLLEGITES